MTKETSLQQRSAEIDLMLKQQEAQFAVTPTGQAFKQFELAQRMGQMLSQSTVVPKAYNGNVANCAVAVDMAMRMQMPPLMVMQNLYVVNGNPAWSSKFLIACIVACGRYTTLEYHYKEGVPEDSDEYGCRCVAYERTDVKRERPLEGPWVTWKMVKDEGWLSKSGSKWKTLPDLMFRYRAAAFWQRVYAPELAMGINTVEEAYDAAPAPKPVDVAYEDMDDRPAPVSDEELNDALNVLDAAMTSDEVKALKQSLAKIYDSSVVFRDALIDRYQALRGMEDMRREEQDAEQQTAEQQE